MDDDSKDRIEFFASTGAGPSATADVEESGCQFVMWSVAGHEVVHLARSPALLQLISSLTH